MDKKSRIWLIVLALLLAVALILCVVFKLRADELDRRTVALKDELAAALITAEPTVEPVDDDAAAIAELETRISELSAQLEAAQLHEAELRAQADLMAVEIETLHAANAECDHQTQLDEKQTELDTLQAELELKQTELTAMQTEIETNAVDIASLRSELDVKQTELDALQAQLDEKQTELDALQAELDINAVDMASLQAELDANASDMVSLLAELDTSAADIASLQAEIDANEADIAGLTAELEAKQAELDTAAAGLAAAETALSDMTAQRDTAVADLAEAGAKVEELTAVLDTVSVEYAALEAQLAEALSAQADAASLDEGEFHASATMQEVVSVASDGVSAIYDLTNSNMSGNSIIFELKLDGEVIYTSGKLAPGESLPEFSLEDPLAAGIYEANASIITLSADGGVSSRMSVPVTVTVAE